VTKMQAALRNVEDHALRAWLYARIDEGLTHMVTSNTTAWSADHCDRGVSFAKRPHDRFLDRVTADMEPCPGLDYSGAVNDVSAPISALETARDEIVRLGGTPGPEIYNEIDKAIKGE
jgi:hypothetical protein